MSEKVTLTEDQAYIMGRATYSMILRLSEEDYQKVQERAKEVAKRRKAEGKA